jgi:hypothetical protein
VAAVHRRRAFCIVRSIRKAIGFSSGAPRIFSTSF